MLSVPCLPVYVNQQSQTLGKMKHSHC